MVVGVEGKDHNSSYQLELELVGASQYLKYVRVKCKLATTSKVLISVEDGIESYLRPFQFCTELSTINVLY